MTINCFNLKFFKQTQLVNRRKLLKFLEVTMPDKTTA